MPRVDAAQLLKHSQAILEKLGASAGDAHTVADHLVGANLAGHDSHGVVRLVQYSQHVDEGKIAPSAPVKTLKETETTALLDGNKTWGQVVAKHAIDVAIQKAQRTGLAAVSVRNCYHIGRVGVYPQMVADAGMIAQLYCNGHGVARIAPWGCRDARLATNPIAIAIPTSGESIVVDITTSVVAEGKVRVAKNSGKSIPEGWILDQSGEPSTDPGDLYDGGTILPLGGKQGHKGFGLGVVVDLLGGALSGAGCGFMTEATGNGLFLQVTNPAAFSEEGEFQARVDEYVTYLRTSPTLDGVEQLLLPGDPEHLTRRRRLEEGIEIDEGSWNQLTEVAKGLGIALS